MAGLRRHARVRAHKEVAVIQMLASANAVYLVSLAACLYMTGLIWFVQVVHYPLFARVGEEAFVAYENAHTRLTTWVVVGPMIAELFTAALLLVHRPAWFNLSWAVAGVVLVGVVWLSTFALQVPMHAILERGFDAEAQRRLVVTNWVRTGAWSLRAFLLFVPLFRALQPVS
jgi:hypothetical protein